MDQDARVRYVDLVDVAKLQSLLESLHHATGMANAILDIDGSIIVHAGWQDACTRFHRANGETCQRCKESDTALAESAMRGLPFGIYNCLNGLVDTVAPIVVEGRHLANVFAGQFLTSPPDMEFFRRQARQFGFDEEQYLEAISRVPIVAQDKVESLTRLYAQLAQMLADNGLNRLRERRSMQELARRTAQLESANREFEEFSYSMSHDMRVPLRAMDGFSGILLDEYGPQFDDEGRRLLRVVRDNALRMGRLVDDILHFLSLGRRKMEFSRIDVAGLAAEICAGMQAAVPARRLRFEIGALPQAWGDPAMIREVLQNLLSNAVKFSPAESEAQIGIDGVAGEGENVYSVTDHGAGFDMRYAGKLFRVFERVHPTGQYEGSGIGLAIVKRIVEQHGGRVWARGKMNEGATFYFSLPHKETGNG